MEEKTGYLATGKPERLQSEEPRIEAGEKRINKITTPTGVEYEIFRITTTITISIHSPCL